MFAQVKVKIHVSFSTYLPSRRSPPNFLKKEIPPPTRGGRGRTSRAETVWDGCSIMFVVINIRIININNYSFDYVLQLKEGFSWQEYVPF